MTRGPCPSPGYCALNGCTGDACSRTSWPAVPVTPRPPLLELAFGLACLFAVPVAGAVVFVAAWVLL